MSSKVTTDFWQLFNDLPENIQLLAKKNYDLWKEDHSHPSLRFKPIKNSVFSIRIGIYYRALSYFEKEINTITWFFVGSHADYDKVVKTI